MVKPKIKGMLKVLVLATIIREGKTHGYEVYKNLSKIRGEWWKPSIGTIYRVLNEMVSEGLISREEEKLGKRMIAYYTPTEAGIREFTVRSRVFLERTCLGLDLLTTTYKSLRRRGIADKSLESYLKKIYMLLSRFYEEA